MASLEKQHKKKAIGFGHGNNKQAHVNRMKINTAV
jgi:hypothetical protein